MSKIESLNFELEGINIEGKNYITLSKNNWKIEQTEELLILSEIEPKPEF